MGNTQSFCQAGEHSEEKLRTIEELLPGESAAETGGSFIPDSVTTRISGDDSNQGEENGANVVVVTAEDVPKGHAEEEIQEEETEKKTIVLHTAPIDPRFSGTNAARYCYVAYNEYHKCAAQKGEDDAECKAKAKTYRSICPSEWLAHWNELREEGKWFGKY